MANMCGCTHCTCEKSAYNLPACLIILDGFGIDEPSAANAIAQAETSVLDELFATCPHTTLLASGEAVGLPAGQMGNSEVGHLNIGAGRVVHQELSRINRACADGSLATNEVLQHAFATAKAEGSALHLMGLLSDGGVHSSNQHLYALLRAAVDAGVPHIMVHCFMDGRDVPPTSGVNYICQLADEIERIHAENPTYAGTIEVASIMGRYYAMDRDNRWDRVERAYNTLVNAEGKTCFGPQAVMVESYRAETTDEFVEPRALSNRGVQTGDAVVFFNFRPDRAREITRAFTDTNFDGFERTRVPQVEFVCLTEYDPTIEAAVAFPKTFPENVLADVLAHAGLSQYHIAETEKYAHVTFFLNGGREELKAGEERILIPSPKVATYDLQPEMSAPGVASTLAKAIEKGEADVYIVNFANCDMVGHTGDMAAAIRAVEAVDAAVGEVLAAVRDAGGVALVTADHGNADKMVDADGTSPFTAHTTAPVPLILCDHTPDASASKRSLNSEMGSLADIAPTLLALIGIDAPPEMTGKNLLVYG